MSDDTQRPPPPAPETSPEDETILAALSTLEWRGPAVLTPAAPLAPESETLKRLYDELLGLVPFGLAPLPPPPELKRRLLSTVLASLETDAVAPWAPPPAPSEPSGFSPAAAGPLSWPEESAPPAAAPPAPLSSLRSEPAAPIPPAPPASPVRRRPAVRWPVVIAAGLVLAVLGLAGFLFQTVNEQNQTIARLSMERDLARQRLEDTGGRSRELLRLLDDLRSRLALVTSPAVEISPLRPAAGAPQQARGVLFVAADHQHWYLCLQGLRPAGSGHAYQLWFIAEQGTVSGGLFDARPGAAAELESKTMPRATRSVSVTLEPERGSARPSGPEVLRAASIFQVL